MSLSNKVWYFAYDADVNVGQMSRQVGEWNLSKRALARSCRLAFDVFSSKWQGCVANLKQTDRFEDTVHGVVYLLTEDQFLRLQKHEGIPPLELKVELEDGNEISHAKTFVRAATAAERPPPEPYRRAMEDGLLEHGYKKPLVDRILAGAGTRGRADA